MTEPTTPAEWNECMAKMLGLTIHGCDMEGVLLNEYPPTRTTERPHKCTNFWTDSAAAMWLLERFCEERGLDPVLEKYQGVWECALWHDVDGGSKILCKGEGAFPEAICWAIWKAR